MTTFYSCTHSTSFNSVTSRMLRKIFPRDLLHKATTKTSRPSDPADFEIFAGEQFRSFPPRNNRKCVIKWNLTMNGDAEFLTGDPRWHNFLLGISPLGFIFTGVEHLHIAFSITRQTKNNLVFLFLVLLLRIINMTRANYALTMFIREKSNVSYRDRRYEFMRV